MSPAEYPVGYCKPPISSQFQKGKSGNPLGRPRGSKNIVLLLARLLKKKMAVTIDGTSKRITIAEAIALQLVKKAITGDARAMMQVIQLQGLAEQIRRSSEKEVLDSINFEKMTAEQLNQVIWLTASPELLKAAGIEEPLDLKMARKFLGGRESL